MIARIWHGWTTPESADIYERLLKTEIFPGIFEKRIAGLPAHPAAAAGCRPRSRVHHNHVVHARWKL
jgi:hypothetical protein